MNNRYISLKLEKSLQEKLAKYFIAQIKEIKNLADLSYSICINSLSKPENSAFYAIAEITKLSKSLKNFVNETEGIEIIEDISEYEILENDCEFQNLLLTSQSKCESVIARTLLIFKVKDFKEITSLLYKHLSWIEFEQIPFAFMHLSKKFQPRMFESSKICFLLLNFDASNILKLPEINNIKVIKYFEYVTESLKGIFIFEREKPLLASYIQSSDEIVLAGNLKPPISIKYKHFKPMRQYISFRNPEIVEPEIIDNVKVDVSVKSFYDPKSEISDIDEYSYIAFQLNIAQAYYDEIFNDVELENLSFGFFNVSNSEKLIVFDKKFISLMSDKLKHLQKFGLFFRKIANNVFVSHIIKFKPVPEKSWFETEFSINNSKNDDLLLLPEVSKLKDYFNLTKKEHSIISLGGKQSLKTANVLKVGQNWTSADNLIYAVKPKLGKIIENQLQSSLDRIINPEVKDQ